MLFRTATAGDIAYCTAHSMSRAPKEYPQSVDRVFALEHDGVVLGVGGVKLLNEYSAWCWINWSTAARENVYTVYRVTKEWLDELVKQHRLVRLMAAVDPTFEEAVRTVEHLGFVKESVMFRFFGDRDAWMYVRLED